jgi:cation diffusion facilitator family transporter
MKILIGMIAGSIAIISDGINNLADASSSVITLIGFKLASMPEDKDHPYGHARYEYLTGLLISVLIIVVGVQLLKSSFLKVLNPDPISFSYVTVIVLAVAIVIKLWQARFNITIGKKIHSSALIATGTDSRNDVISTTAVLISVLVFQYTGLQIDGYMGCLVAVFIVWSGCQLVKETSSPLLGEAPEPELVDAIMEAISREPDILGTHDLRVHNYGPGKTFASIHAEVDARGSLVEVHDMIDRVEHAVQDALHIELVIHMDPVTIDDPSIQ